MTELFVVGAAQGTDVAEGREAEQVGASSQPLSNARESYEGYCERTRREWDEAPETVRVP